MTETTSLKTVMMLLFHAIFFVQLACRLGEMRPAQTARTLSFYASADAATEIVHERLLLSLVHD
eukprot:CAMPEP_0204270572 /NCGR_PEP_ID=MMETSP0468-20130131/18972_1 /ASSEMBLY_ACC=CAM_ASM_000383 /TAXON_ID=2969 /ORGANISM="Oxyrrhis marina" /LENGTH=63 /DNA_ID=CAMNT_0051246125 /DNA_START=182 /DNA_END=373 /DNA_ORIENTATION=+